MGTLRKEPFLSLKPQGLIQCLRNSVFSTYVYLVELITTNKVIPVNSQLNKALNCLVTAPYSSSILIFLHRMHCIYNMLYFICFLFYI